MSRHRDIRNMDYSDDYHGYDDVYGHSVDDEYSISPSSRQFMYNRDGSRESAQNNIQEENENEQISELVEAKLQSCIEHIRNSIGSSCKLTNTELTQIIRKCQFDAEASLDAVLNTSQIAKVYGADPPTPTINVTPPVMVVVAATGKSSGNITRGFDIISKTNNFTTPRSLSPASNRTTPSPEERTPKVQASKIEDVQAQYKERQSGKQHLYMVVIGHVDAGKSTLMGRLLCDLGRVSQKTMHKYEQESQKMGKQSFVYAWVLDETGEERARGITMDVARHQFDAPSKVVTLLDAPGHKDFIPNMISGASQADVALLVVDATRGEFETGFESGGQTREHTLLVRSLGVTQLVVAVNKLDTVDWSENRFVDIMDKLKIFFKQVGFKESGSDAVTFVPCSGLTGLNLTKRVTNHPLSTWYTGPCLIEAIDAFKVPARPITKPLRFTVNDIFKGTGSGFCVSGRVETGALSVGERIAVYPAKEMASVKTISMEDTNQNIIFAGDQATLCLFGIDMQNVSVGSVICDSTNPVEITSKLQARVVFFTLPVPLTPGYPVEFHQQSLIEGAVVSKLISQLNRSTGEVVRKRPRFLSSNSSAVIEIQIGKPVAVELYSVCKELGRFMLRIGGVTIGAGLVTQIIN